MLTAAASLISTLPGEVCHVASTMDPDTAAGRGIPSKNARGIAQGSVSGSSGITFGPILPDSVGHLGNVGSD
jgi:hypothetical protein